MPSPSATLTRSRNRTPSGSPGRGEKPLRPGCFSAWSAGWHGGCVREDLGGAPCARTGNLTRGHHHPVGVDRDPADALVARFHRGERRRPDSHPARDRAGRAAVPVDHGPLGALAPQSFSGVPEGRRRPPPWAARSRSGSPAVRRCRWPTGRRSGAEGAVRRGGPSCSSSARVRARSRGRA